MSSIMNELTVEQIRQQLTIDIGQAYAKPNDTNIDDKVAFASLCADAGILYLTVQGLAVESGCGRKATRKKSRDDLRKIKAFIRENVDFQPSGVLVSFFWTFIAPMIIHWIAKRILELLS